MNANAVARHYGSLTPEERFRLILAASGRGDEVERIRLVSAAPRITLAMPDHSPFAQAFRELAFLIFIELLAEAGRYTEALALAAFFLFGLFLGAGVGEGEGLGIAAGLGQQFDEDQEG